MKTFTKRFSKSLAVTVEFMDEIPKEFRGAPLISTTWENGKMPPQGFKPYIAWMNSVNKEMADHYGEPLMQIYMLGGTKSQTWFFQPGKRPKRMAEKR